MSWIDRSLVHVGAIQISPYEYLTQSTLKKMRAGREQARAWEPPEVGGNSPNAEKIGFSFTLISITE